MVRERMFGSDNEFCAWMRACKELPSIAPDFGFVATDCDVIVHRYKTVSDSVGTREVQGIMQIEVKTRGGTPTASQIDTVSKINMFSGDKQSNGVCVRNFGVFFLALSGTTPDDSEWMLWAKFRDKKPGNNLNHLESNYITRQELIDILRFERHPRNLKDTKPFRRHHLTREFIEKVETPLGFSIEKPVIKRS